MKCSYVPKKHGVFSHALSWVFTMADRNQEIELFQSVCVDEMYRGMFNIVDRLKAKRCALKFTKICTRNNL